jgi:sec-independent protein translocase protein TatA
MIGTIVVLLFGAKKLPDVARGLGHGIRNFKGELKRDTSEEQDQKALPPEDRSAP